MAVENLITEHLDIWTSAIKTKSAAGRGSSKKLELVGVKKLRELILELAFCGKLVPNDINYCVHDDILNNMAAEKEHFHNKKNVRLQKFKTITEKFELPPIPKSWKSVYFDEVITYITDFQANGSFSTLKQNVTYYDEKNYALLVRLTDLRHGLSDSRSFKYTDKKGFDFLSKSSIEGGEFVVANVGAGVGTTLEVPNIDMPATLAPNMFMIVLSKLIAKRYFLYYSQSPVYKRYIELVNAGTGQPKINKTEYKNCKLPLPSTEEQHRIVAKVDELMALCDQLEAQTESSIDAHKTLVEVLLATLTDAKDANELNDSWQRLSQHFDVLFTTQASIDQLKQTILQLAVMGKLVKQDPKDEPASKLLERIATEKQQLIKDGKIKKQKPLPSITDEEKPFELPDGWEFSCLQDITLLITDGKHGDCNNLENSGYFFLSAKDIKNGKLVYDNARQIESSEFAEVHQRTNLEHGDICMVNTGATVGKMAIVEDIQFTRKTTFQKSVAVIKVAKLNINNRYAALFLQSETRNFLKKSGGSAINNLLLGDLKKKITPVPPLIEQHRIVAKVDELMTLCDSLKANLRQAQITQLHLTDAIVEQTL
ncbi:restriction endonuclease subunit S [Paraglaciecola sp. MB-3u-78]|uniref:restriction endonuclease subunit S n=1 Tax=Paraglaciecola sp. MB-3u-78 TaxID=2058332 RepID=UPI000C34B65D|nr:restriction endonuclease subunit S [Paraglaciecola sp. MB-3u-78]PKH00881.1 type I restriction endonuclease subunit S [Paraglaciecola sp. MB-3u-78]